MTSPHHVGQLAAATREIAHVLDTAPTAATSDRVAIVVLQQLQNLGWAPPHDLSETVPLTGPGADPQHRAACKAEIDAAIAAAKARKRPPVAP